MIILNIAIEELNHNMIVAMGNPCRIGASADEEKMGKLVSTLTCIAIDAAGKGHKHSVMASGMHSPTLAKIIRQMIKEAQAQAPKPPEEESETE